MKIIRTIVANRSFTSNALSFLTCAINPVKRHEHCLLGFKYYNKRAFSYSKFNCQNKESTIEFNTTTENHLLTNAAEKEDAPEPSSDFLKTLCYEDRVRIQTALTELKEHKRSGCAIPTYISDDQWNVIIELSSFFRRLRFLRYLASNEKRKNRRKENQAENRLLTEEYRKKQKEKAKVEPFDGLEYGLSKNCLFLQLTTSTQTKVYNSRLCQASMFGQKLILDLSYSDCMSRKEYVNCALQLADVYSHNRQNRQPFDLHFCNVKKEMAYHECLLKAMPYLYSDTCFLNITAESYMNHFPKEKLVYLSPHSEECMTEFDPDAIYIIGALVDKSRTTPVSLIKAAENNIRTARFPIERYLNWGAGNKSLPLQQVIGILLDIKNTGDWAKAFRHIPSKYLKSSGLKNS